MAVNSTITHTQDLTKPLTITALRHNLVAGDQMGDKFDVTVTENGKAVSLSSASVQGYFIRVGDGATVIIPGRADGNVASVTLPESCYVVPGRFTLTIKVNVGSVRHAVYVAEGAVIRSSTDAIVDPGHNIPDIGELLAMIDRLESTTDAAQKASTAANTAAGKADAASTAASTAAGKASDAASTAAKWGDVTATVTMLDAGASPVVTLTDTSTGKTMAFKLPRGLTGLTPKLAIGTVNTGAPGTKVTATLTGTAEAPVLNLTIPQGDTGSIENLTINGIHFDSGTITLTPENIGALSADGTAKLAKALENARKISLTGDVTGSVDFDGAKNAEIPVKIERSNVIRLFGGSISSVAINGSIAMNQEPLPSRPIFADFGNQTRAAVGHVSNDKSTINFFVISASNEGSVLMYQFRFEVSPDNSKTYIYKSGYRINFNSSGTTSYTSNVVLPYIGNFIQYIN